MFKGQLSHNFISEESIYWTLVSRQQVFALRYVIFWLSLLPVRNNMNVSSVLVTAHIAVIKHLTRHLIGSQLHGTVHYGRKVTGKGSHDLHNQEAETDKCPCSGHFHAIQDPSPRNNVTHNHLSVN